MEIVNFKNLSQKDEVFQVLKELRPHLNHDQFLKLFSESEKEGFQIVALIEDRHVRAVMGYRILHDFTHGKHLYIDDLVTREIDRSKGFGKFLLDYAERTAKENQCTLLRLCSGIDREDAHRFYKRENWTPKSIAFKKKI